MVSIAGIVVSVMKCLLAFVPLTLIVSRYEYGTPDTTIARVLVNPAIDWINEDFASRHTSSPRLRKRK